jgi:hypothetical protein
MKLFRSHPRWIFLYGICISSLSVGCKDDPNSTPKPVTGNGSNGAEPVENDVSTNKVTTSSLSTASTIATSTNPSKFYFSVADFLPATSEPTAKELIDEYTKGIEIQDRFRGMSVDEVLAKGSEYALRADENGAFGMLKQANAIDPENPGVKFYAARLLAEKKKFAAAVELIESIESSDPMVLFAVHGQSAEWYIEMGKLTRAKSRLTDIVRRQPNADRGWSLLNRVESFQGDYVGMQRSLKKLVELGSIDWLQLRYSLAPDSFREDAKLRKNIATYADEGQSQSDLQSLAYDARAALAKNDTQRSIQLWSEYFVNDQVPTAERIEYVCWYGVALAQQSDREVMKLWSSYVKTCRNANKCWLYWIVLGDIARLDSKPTLAEEAYKRSLVINPCSRLANQKLSELHAAQSNTASSEFLAKRSASLQRIEQLMDTANRRGGFEVRELDEVKVALRSLGEASLIPLLLMHTKTPLPDSDTSPIESSSIEHDLALKAEYLPSRNEIDGWTEFMREF